MKMKQMYRKDCLLLLSFLCFRRAVFQEDVIFHYQNDVKWSKDLVPFWNWFQNIDTMQLVCAKINQTIDNEMKMQTYSKPLEKVSKCSDVHGNINFDSKFDTNHLPHGKGSASRTEKTHKKGPKIPCYGLLPSIERITGYFHHGELDGRAKIR